MYKKIDQNDISYLSTIVGCIVAYYLSDKLFGMYVKKKMDIL